MNTHGKRGDSAVDEILSELKSSGAPLPKAENSAIDAIMAELGMGNSPPQKFSPRSVPSASPPAAQPAPIAAPAASSPTAQDTPPISAQPIPLWDTIPLDTTASLPRIGKAAAMDTVTPDKYMGETELLSWWDNQDNENLSKKEQRQLNKENRKREAAERKEAKRLAKYGPDEDEDDGLAEDEPPELEPFNIPESDDDIWASANAERTDPLLDVVVDDILGADQAPDFAADAESAIDRGDTLPFAPPSPKSASAQPQNIADSGLINTQTYDLNEDELTRTPTATFTQEFDTDGETSTQGPKPDDATKNLFLDDMVDDRFREFFEKTVIVDKEEIDNTARQARARRKNKKSRSALLTGEFSRLAELAEEAEEAQQSGHSADDEDELDDYNRPQDAGAVEKDLHILRKTLTRRTIISLSAGLILLWLALAFAGTLPVFSFISPVENPLYFALLYLLFIIVAVAVNFTTVSAGLIGLVAEPTVDSAPALAAVGVLLQGVVVLVQLLTKQTVEVTLFGCIGAFLLGFNALGKRIRAQSIINNFHQASAGFDHSAAYILDDGHELAANVTRGLQEEDPSLLISRPTALVKGFLRQSFSQRWSDRIGRVLGWVVLAAALVVAVISFINTNNMLTALSSFAALVCIAAPLSSTLVSAVPSALLQKSTSKVGAVVPGWSAIEELGQVNVVMAGARDIFPPSSVRLQGIKTFEKERIDLAILYAASVLIEGCDTMRDIFLGVIQGKQDMLYKVESLVTEPGRGFTAWVENSRVVIGTREMLQKHDINPPPIEVEMKHTTDDCLPMYLAVSGKLIAMFIISYVPDEEVDETLEGLIKSGVSLLVTSDDMNVTGELIERVYSLPPGVVKVLARRELEMLEPLTAYLPESDGVMTHIGTFTSFIGGMRAAAGCAASEHMSGIVQIASVALACLLCAMLVFSGGLSTLALSIAVLYHLGWTVLVCALPFARRY